LSISMNDARFCPNVRIPTDEIFGNDKGQNSQV
jgi:hypothetical protein